MELKFFRRATDILLSDRYVFKISTKNTIFQLTSWWGCLHCEKQRHKCLHWENNGCVKIDTLTPQKESVLHHDLHLHFVWNFVICMHENCFILEQHKELIHYKATRSSMGDCPAVSGKTYAKSFMMSFILFNSSSQQHL